MRWIKLPVFFICLGLIPGFAVSLWPQVVRFGAFTLRHILFMGGATICIVLFPLLRKSHFFRTFEHELTHLVAAKAFLARMESLKVSASGEGEVRYSRESNFVIALAPYFLPLFALIFTLLIPLLHPKIAVFAFAPAGFLLMHHLLSGFTEAFIGQPDIKESGRVFSPIFIGFLGLFAYGCIISYAAGGHESVFEFLKRGPVESWRLVSVYVPLAAGKVWWWLKDVWKNA